MLPTNLRQSCGTGAVVAVEPLVPHTDVDGQTPMCCCFSQLPETSSTSGDATMTAPDESGTFEGLNSLLARRLSVPARPNRAPDVDTVVLRPPPPPTPSPIGQYLEPTLQPNIVRKFPPLVPPLILSVPPPPPLPLPLLSLLTKLRRTLRLDVLPVLATPSSHSNSVVPCAVFALRSRCLLVVYRSNFESVKFNNVRKHSPRF